MVEMINYIFGSLKASTDAVKGVKKTLRNQMIFNKRLTVFAVVITAYTIAAEIKIYEQDKKLEELGKEIGKLKRMIFNKRLTDAVKGVKKTLRNQTRGE